MLALAPALLAALLPTPATAQAPATVVSYARALEWFNPALDGNSAASFAQTTIAAADREHIDARLLVALIAVESRWDPRAISPAGAAGLGQLMPRTAAELGVDPFDARQNIRGTARYLRVLLDAFARNGQPSQSVLALAAYNAGLRAVERYGGVPPYAQTRSYVRRVLTLWRRLSGERAPQTVRPPVPSRQ